DAHEPASARRAPPPKATPRAGRAAHDHQGGGIPKPAFPTTTSPSGWPGARRARASRKGAPSNKRLKLPGGDRLKGSGVLCGGAHELSFNERGGGGRVARSRLKSSHAARPSHMRCLKKDKL